MEAPPDGRNGDGVDPEGEAVEEVRALLEVVIEALDLDATLSVVDEGETIIASLEGEDLGLFIGRHGQTIDAVQHLAYKVAARGESPAPRVIVDAAGYREHRESAVKHQADQAAAKVVEDKQPVALPPMSASDRKIVHEYLKERGDVETYSEGNEPHRYLVVAPLGRS